LALPRETVPLGSERDPAGDRAAGLEKMGMAGLPVLIGIDISESLKTGNSLVGAETPQDTIYGVYGGLARKGLNTTSTAEREELSPDLGIRVAGIHRGDPEGLPEERTRSYYAAKGEDHHRGRRKVDPSAIHI